MFVVRFHKEHRGEREGESKRGGGYAERATFHEGLEHFVKYYVFTKIKKKEKEKETELRKQSVPYFFFKYRPSPVKLSPPKNRYFAPTDNFKAGGDNFKGVAGTTFAPPSSHQNGHPPTVREIVPPFFRT